MNMLILRAQLQAANPGDHVLLDNSGEDLSMTVPGFMTANIGQSMHDHYAEVVINGDMADDRAAQLEISRAAQLERFRRSVGGTGLLHAVLASNEGR